MRGFLLMVEKLDFFPSNDVFWWILSDILRERRPTTKPQNKRTVGLNKLRGRPYVPPCTSNL